MKQHFHPNIHYSCRCKYVAKSANELENLFRKQFQSHQVINLGNLFDLSHAHRIPFK